MNTLHKMNMLQIITAFNIYKTLQCYCFLAAKVQEALIEQPLTIKNADIL